MSQPAIPLQSPLPQSTVLSYVASLESPTRVRLIASRTLRILGGVLLLFSLIALVFAIVDFYQFARTALWTYPSTVTTYGYAVAPVSTSEMLKDHILRNPIPLVILAFTFVPGVMLVTGAGAVQRGRKIGCIIAILPMLLLLLAAFDLAFVLSLMFAGTISGTLGSRLHILWQLPAVAVALLLTLFAKDLIALLIWIFRNPITEKPHVPFL